MNPIVERTIALETLERKQHDLIIKINVPVPDQEEGGDWACKFRIIGSSIDIAKTAYGVDSLQALIHAIIAVRANLELIQKIHKVKLTWLGMDNLGLTMDNLMGQ